MGFGRVGGYGIGIGSAGGGVTPVFAESFYGPIQVVFSFPFLEYESARMVLFVADDFGYICLDKGKES